MRLNFVLRTIGVLALAFVLTSAVMFWLPFVLPKETGWFDTGYDVYDTATPVGFTTDALKNLSPIEERQILESISDELKQKQSAELFQLKAYDDLCANGLVDCQGLKSEKVKPFIDAILADRQASNTAFSASMSNEIASGSLFVSFIALIFTALGYHRKRKLDSDAPK